MFFFAKNGQKLKFLGFDANGLKFKFPAQRGMATLILTFLSKIIAFFTRAYFMVFCNRWLNGIVL